MFSCSFISFTLFFFFFFNNTATTDIYTLSLHDALPISYFATFRHQLTILSKTDALDEEKWLNMLGTFVKDWFRQNRSEERFSRNAETDLVCRLLLEKKNKLNKMNYNNYMNI